MFEEPKKSQVLLFVDPKQYVEFGIKINTNKNTTKVILWYSYHAKTECFVQKLYLMEIFVKINHR